MRSLASFFRFWGLYSLASLSGFFALSLSIGVLFRSKLFILLLSRLFRLVILDLHPISKLLAPNSL